MKRYTTLVLFALVFVLAFALTGCSAKGSAKKTGPQIAEVGAQVNGTLKEGYPKDLPLWAGATVKSSKDTKKGDAEAYEAEFLIKAAYDKVSYGYGEGLKQAGWNPQTVSQDSKSVLISATKGGTSAAITLNNNGDGTVSVVISAQLK